MSHRLSTVVQCNNTNGVVREVRGNRSSLEAWADTATIGLLMQFLLMQNLQILGTELG